MENILRDLTASGDGSRCSVYRGLLGSVILSRPVVLPENRRRKVVEGGAVAAIRWAERVQKESGREEREEREREI
ncbi:hypothetical protein TorRG33x02_357080, partial [Trema orientale]